MDPMERALPSGGGPLLQSTPPNDWRSDRQLPPLPSHLWGKFGTIDPSSRRGFLPRFSDSWSDRHVAYKKRLR